MSQIEQLSLRLIQNAVVKATEGSTEEILTDFHVHTHSDTCEVRITDDTGEVLGTATFDGYEEKNSKDFRKVVGKSLKQVLSKMDAQHEFDSLNIFRPFSFVMADEEDEAEELYVVDNDSIMVSDELLKGLDSELNDFLNHLLKE